MQQPWYWEDHTIYSLLAQNCLHMHHNLCAKGTVQINQDQTNTKVTSTPLSNHQDSEDHTSPCQFVHYRHNVFLIALVASPSHIRLAIQLRTPSNWLNLSICKSWALDHFATLTTWPCFIAFLQVSLSVVSCQGIIFFLERESESGSLCYSNLLTML